MKYTIIVILSFITQTTFSQINATCIYKITPIKEMFKIKDSDNEADKSSKDMLLKAYSLAANFDYSLKFNQNVSISSIDKSLKNEGVQNSYLYSIAEALIGKGIYFQDKKNNITLRQTSSMGSLFIIKDVLKKNWKIINIRKKIGQYNCIKAILDCENCGSTETIWFTPDIPVPFGPLGYGGLPGLIVEIDRYSSVIKLKSIKLTKTNIKIEKPTKGKEISIVEYNKITSNVRSRAYMIDN